MYEFSMMIPVPPQLSVNVPPRVAAARLEVSGNTQQPVSLVTVEVGKSSSGRVGEPLQSEEV